MWTPTGCAASFNWSTASTSARDFPAASARRRFGGLWWQDGGRTTVLAASDERAYYGLWKKTPKKTTRIENIFHFFIRKSLKSREYRSGKKISIKKAPGVYGRWKSNDQPKEQQAPGTGPPQR